MVHVPRRRGWEIPERQATPQSAYLHRREFLKRLGVAGAGLAMGVAGGTAIHPARRNTRLAIDSPLTDEQAASAHTCFCELTEDGRVADFARRLETRPWRIETAGWVAKPRTIDVDDLIRRMPIEERLYRHRCAAGWTMAVPWTGFPLRELVKWAAPSARARYLRVVSFLRPDEAPNQQRATWYPWPYAEAYRMDEAMNELAFVVTGAYGHDLPGARGAPLRLAMPWKYGFKSPKSVVRFEFAGEQPATFWSSIAPDAYGFLANVNPAVPHPRWSQANERMIGTRERRPTLPYNGYGEWVSGMYDRDSETWRS